MDVDKDWEKHCKHLNIIFEALELDLTYEKKERLKKEIKKK